MDASKLQNESAKSSIQIDRRTSRSIPNAALQHIVKPISGILMKPGEPQPQGSPILTPHKSAEKTCRISKRQVEGIWIYTFSDHLQTSATKPTHNLYYFAGGGFRGPAAKEHWLLCAEMCSKLPQYVINLVSYPLGPNNTAPTALPALQRMYRSLSSEARDQRLWMTLMGDSAGANIALVLGIYAASSFSEDAAKDDVCPLRNILAICPATDLRNENPEIDNVSLKDPLLSREIIESAASVWHGNLPVSDPQLSPILADLSVLQRANVKVDGVTAGLDVLAPDGILFRNRLGELGVRGDWLHWEKQIHCFPLMFSYHIHEGVAGKDWILEALASNQRSVA